ncbi:MAG: YihY/virulence factor BrkB family protein [Actinobacteria bacterium]|nr:YihY/virulence factor BrkB family protein [Actinomycetota bacterium]
MPEGGTDSETQPGWFDRVLIDPLDALQRRIRPVAFTVALFKRFSEDRGSQYSTLLAYYGFFSLLAILLVIGTISATVLSQSPERQQTLTDAITKALPVTGDTVATNVQKLNGSGFAVLIGLLIVTWSGLGVVNNAQDAFNTMWSVPRYHWPSLWVRIGRSAAVLGVAGLALTALTAGGPILSALELGSFQLVLAAVGAAAINTGALAVCLELLTKKRIGLKNLLPGAIGGGIALVILQLGGTWYMTRVVARAGAFYGTFAAAIGVLVWIGLQARLILLASEVNVVRAKALWPRSLTGRNLTDADRRAHSDLIERESLFAGAVIDTQIEQ